MRTFNDLSVYDGNELFEIFPVGYTKVFQQSSDSVAFLEFYS